MDQKNTIVKCKAHPNCLFNHNRVCDNYVINIGADGKCESYVETASSEEESIYNKTKEKLKGSDIILLNRECGECNYFVDTGLLQCPCDKHEQYVYRKAPACGDFKAKRGQRANDNIYDDACDASFLKEDLEKIQQTLEQDFIPCTMKIAEFNKPNKNQSVISDWDYAATPDICKTCKKVVYGQPCKYKNVAYGIWACYEQDESIKKAGALDVCWWCDFFNSEKRSCKHKNPDIDKLGCHSLQSTGGNI